MIFSHLLCLLAPGASSLTVHLIRYLKLLCRNHLNFSVIFSSYKRNASSDSSSLSSIAISDISQFNMMQSWSVVSANCCSPLALPDYWSIALQDSCLKGSILSGLSYSAITLQLLLPNFIKLSKVPLSLSAAISKGKSDLKWQAHISQFHYFPRCWATDSLLFLAFPCLQVYVLIAVTFSNSQ